MTATHATEYCMKATSSTLYCMMATHATVYCMTATHLTVYCIMATHSNACQTLEPRALQCDMQSAIQKQLAVVHSTTTSHLPLWVCILLNTGKKGEEGVWKVSDRIAFQFSAAGSDENIASEFTRPCWIGRPFLWLSLLKNRRLHHETVQIVETYLNVIAERGAMVYTVRSPTWLQRSWKKSCSSLLLAFSLQLLSSTPSILKASSLFSGSSTLWPAALASCSRTSLHVYLQPWKSQTQARSSSPVFLFQPIYWLGHPEE